VIFDSFLLLFYVKYDKMIEVFLYGKTWFMKLLDVEQNRMSNKEVL